MADPQRLDDAAIQQRLSRINELLEHLEQYPGPTSGAAVEAVEALTEVYGEALARVLRIAPPPMAGELAGDELVGHLMALHEVHPEPLADRVERALADVRPHVEPNGGRVELAEISEGIARIRLSGTAKGCSSSAATLQQAVTESVLALAPELTGVDAVQDAADQRSESVIPVDSLFSRTRAGRSP